MVKSNFWVFYLSKIEGCDKHGDQNAIRDYMVWRNIGYVYVYYWILVLIIVRKLDSKQTKSEQLTRNSREQFDEWLRDTNNGQTLSRFAHKRSREFGGFKKARVVRRIVKHQTSNVTTNPPFRSCNHCCQLNFSAFYSIFNSISINQN